MDSMIQMVLDSNWADLTKYTEQKAATKLAERISAKKDEIRATFNTGFDEEIAVADKQ